MAIELKGSKLHLGELQLNLASNIPTASGKGFHLAPPINGQVVAVLEDGSQVKVNLHVYRQVVRTNGR